jgi:hypothetical protein
MSAESLAKYVAKTKTNRIGLWLFFVSEAFLFGGLLASRFYLWGDTRPDLDQTIGLLVTVILLLSSFFMNRAETAMANNDRETFLNNMLITAGLGGRGAKRLMPRARTAPMAPAATKSPTVIPRTRAKFVSMMFLLP